MKSVVKIGLGILLGGVLLIGGCAALLAAGVDEAQDESDKTAITLAEYRAVKTGATKDKVIARLGEASSESEIETDVEGLGKAGLDCVYYNREGQLASLFQFCFDENGRLQSKASY